MVFTIGYTNASWTLKADLVSEFFCRIVNHMDEHGYDTVAMQQPRRLGHERPLMISRPATCCGRCTYLPSRAPWRLKQNHPLDLRADPPRQGRRRGPAIQQASLCPVAEQAPIAQPATTNHPARRAVA